MNFRFSPLAILLVVTCMPSVFLRAAPGTEGPLIHWTFDQEGQAPATDSSGNQLHGKLTATRVESPSGRAALMEGRSGSIVSAQLAEDQRFGKGSWTFMAMLKPRQLTIDSKQKQRRVFSFGTYPDANLVLKGGRGQVINLAILLLHRPPPSMPRSPRIDFPGAICHVLGRGN